MDKVTLKQIFDLIDYTNVEVIVGRSYIDYSECGNEMFEISERCYIKRGDSPDTYYPNSDDYAVYKLRIIEEIPCSNTLQILVENPKSY